MKVKFEKRSVTLAVLAIIACVGLGLGAMEVTTPSLSADGGPVVVATVDGKQIPAKIYRMYLKNGIEALGPGEKSDEGRRQIETLKEGIVSELIDRVLIEAEVTRRKHPVPESALAEAYDRTVAQMGGHQAVSPYLAEHALTEDEFRQTVAGDLRSELLRAELDKEVSVTDDEIKDSFKKEKNNSSLADLFKEPERVRARHILINARRSQIASEIQSKEQLSKQEIDQRVTVEMAKRRNRAAALLNRLRGGAEFQTLAAQNSDDAGTKDRGGDLGLFTQNTHTARFDEAAFALKPGQLSGIVETEYGYHIIQVTEHAPERARTFEETRPAIQQRLLSSKRAAHLKEWLENRRREADIRIDPFYRTKQLESLGKNR